jgi:hypothetical protein
VNFLFPVHTEYIELHTHTHVYSLATYRRHTGDHESKTNKSRPLYTSPLSWSTLLLKSLNLPVTLLETTRNERIAAKLTKWLAPVYFSTSPLEPEPLYISPPSWNTSLLKSLNLPIQEWQLLRLPLQDAQLLRLPLQDAQLTREDLPTRHPRRQCRIQRQERLRQGYQAWICRL